MVEVLFASEPVVEAVVLVVADSLTEVVLVVVSESCSLLSLVGSVDVVVVS